MKATISTLDLTREEWLKARKQGIGSSDVAAILGLSKYRTPLEVYEEKISAEIIEQPMTPAMEFGVKLEQVVADTYAERTGRKVVRDNKIRIHPDYQFLLANLDRIIMPINGGGRGILECKTASSRAAKQWETEIPAGYFAQIQHQLFVTGMTWGVLALLVDGRDFQTFDVKRDDGFIGMQVSILSDFWKNHVVPRNPPEATVTDLEVQMAVIGSTIEADEGTTLDIDTLTDARKELARVKAKAEEYEEKVKLYIGNHEMLTHAGRVLATWKSSKPSASIDTKRLQIEVPEIAAKYAITKPGTRRFYLKSGPEENER